MKCKGILMFLRLLWSFLVDLVILLVRGGFSVIKFMGKSELNCIFDFCGIEFYWEFSIK